MTGVFTHWWERAEISTFFGVIFLPELIVLVALCVVMVHVQALLATAIVATVLAAAE